MLDMLWSAEFFFPWMATKMQMPQRMTDGELRPLPCMRTFNRATNVSLASNLK